jgi:hypothetical protein
MKNEAANEDGGVKRKNVRNRRRGVLGGIGRNESV